MTQPSETPGTTDQLCAHCGLPVPATRIAKDSHLQFCCNGCRAVYRLINEHGLNYYYDLKQEDPLPSFPALSQQVEGEFQHFDSDEFNQLYVRRLDGSNPRQARIELFLEGIHCTACVWLIERLPHITPGVTGITVDFGRSTAVLQFQPEIVRLSQIAQTLTSLGYRPHPYRGAEYSALRKEQEHRLLSALGIAAACAGNAMLLAICLYAAAFGYIDTKYWNFFRITSFFVALPSVFWSGQTFYRGAWAALKARRVHLDFPISLGILSGFFASTINVLYSQGEIYFDSITMIVFLLLVSRFLQSRAQHRAAEKAEFLYSILPRTAHQVTGDAVFDTPLESVQRNDILEIRAGDCVPVDGIVLTGSSLINTAVLTGESAPRRVHPGDPLHAGVTNVSSVLRMQVLQTGEETRLGRLARLANDVLQQKPKILHTIDRLSPWFVVFVISLAASGFALGAVHSIADGVQRFVAVLVISCPCALGMATPLAFSTALGFAARIGIHLRSSSPLEAIRQIRHVIFDKTGTLTSGRLSVERHFGDLRHLAAAALIEQSSSHPVAQAIVTAFLPVDIDAGPIIPSHEEAGKGISGSVYGSQYLIGSDAFLGANRVRIDDEWKNHLQDLERDALSPVFIACDGRLVGLLGLGDPIQESALEVTQALEHLGYNVHLLSGDHESIAQHVGAKLGFPPSNIRGGVTPEQKLDYVQQLDSTTVLMLGDGTNDAAALAGAGIGIAVHGGAEASLVVADGFFSRPDLKLVLQLIVGAKHTVAKVHRNLVISLCFNILGCSLAVFGFISPLIAAILMPISSLFVVVSSYIDNPFSPRALVETALSPALNNHRKAPKSQP